MPTGVRPKRGYRPIIQKKGGQTHGLWGGGGAALGERWGRGVAFFDHGNHHSPHNKDSVQKRNRNSPFFTEDGAGGKERRTKKWFIKKTEGRSGLSRLQQKSNPNETAMEKKKQGNERGAGMTTATGPVKKPLFEQARK